MKSKWGVVLAAVGTMAAVLVTMPAFAANFYVDQANASASDSNPGTESLPWKTLYRAKSASLQPGDVVIVKPGTYDASVGGSWSEPAIYPAVSGTATQPITFRAVPRHGAVVQGGGAAPAIGSRGRNYVVIDGFVVTSTNPKGVAVFGAGDYAKVKGVSIVNNIIYGIHNSDPYDNTDGIRVEYASGTRISNNRIYDVHNGTDSYNASAIKLYKTDSTLIENNELSDAAAGIFDKEGGTNNVFRHNYIHDISVVGIQFATQNGTLATGNQVYENVMNRCGKAVFVNPNDGSSVVDNLRVFNNVFANYGSEGGVYPSKYQGKAYFYNNIFYRTGSISVGDFYTYNDPPVTVGLLDYNMYVSSPRFTLGRYQTDRVYTSLSAWQSATGFDRNSLSGNPAFVNATAGDFRLAAGSMAIGAGRAGGSANGAPVNMGAYPTGNEVIGLLGESTAPRPPTLITVE
jgi:hypothetical protein